MPFDEINFFLLLNECNASMVSQVSQQISSTFTDFQLTSQGLVYLIGWFLPIFFCYHLMLTLTGSLIGTVHVSQRAELICFPMPQSSIISLVKRKPFRVADRISILELNAIWLYIHLAFKECCGNFFLMLKEQFLEKTHQITLSFWKNSLNPYILKLFNSNISWLGMKCWTIKWK